MMEPLVTPATADRCGRLNPDTQSQGHGMDPDRFDGWSKSLAIRPTRRRVLTAGSGAALLGLLGIRSRARAQPATGLGDDGVCRLRFEASAAFSPETDGRSGPIAGLLEFTVGDGGGITEGRLTLDSGEQHPMIGHATGRYVSMRIDIGEDALIAVGAGERNVRSCAGIYGGPTSGPQEGELGSWSATTGESAASAGQPTTEQASPTAQTDELGLGPDGICRMEFQSTVRVGPSRLGGDRTAVTRGILELDIGDAGGIGEGMGRLVLDNGRTYPVLGQAPGQSVAFRIDLGGQSIIGVGVGDERTSDCVGTYSGRSIGPADGDLGDWIATAGQGRPISGGVPSGSSAGSSSAGSSSGSTGSSPGSGESSSSPCTLTQNDCSDLLLDLERCACICQETGEPICGERCCGPGATCVNGTDCVCDNGATYCEGHCLGCPAGAVCQDERCICPEQFFYCDDNNTCVFCQSGRTFNPNNGCTCESDCPGAIGAVCNGICVDLAVDAANCGSCGRACASTQVCRDGDCTCPIGTGPCGPNRECMDIYVDTNNCGGCGITCGANETCRDGFCVCRNGFDFCGGAVCIDLLSDAGNCGECGNACRFPNTRCLLGQCTP